MCGIAGIPRPLGQPVGRKTLASIESRFSFLDEVLRFSVNLPVRFRIGRSAWFHNLKHPFLLEKAVVRRAVSGILPSRLVNKKKLGFPMYGHEHMAVRPRFFRGGYISDFLGFTKSVEDYVIREQDPCFVAKLVSVEVLGRLFSLSQSVDDVADHFSGYIWIRQGPQTGLPA